MRRSLGRSVGGRSLIMELCSEHGISEAKACQLLSALELGRRYASLQPEETPVISSPRDVANLLMAEMAFLNQEHLRVLLLNTKNQVIGISEVYKGNVNTAVIRASEDGYQFCVAEIRGAMVA